MTNELSRKSLLCFFALLKFPSSGFGINMCVCRGRFIALINHDFIIHPFEGIGFLTLWEVLLLERARGSRVRGRQQLCL